MSRSGYECCLPEDFCHVCPLEDDERTDVENCYSCEYYGYVGEDPWDD